MRRTLTALALLALLVGAFFPTPGGLATPTVPSEGGSTPPLAVWTGRDVPTSRDLHAVHFHDDLLGWAGADDGVVYRTTDGGRTWSVAHTGLFHAIIAMSWVSATHGWVATGDQGIAATTDGGLTWTVQDKGGWFGSFRDIHFLDESRGYGVGINGIFQGYILQTTDGGATWEWHDFRFTHTESTFRRIQASPDGQRIWIASWLFTIGDGVTLSHDGGLTWTFVPIEGAGGIADVHMVDADNGIAVAQRGQVYRTTDGGLTWTRTLVPTVSNLYDVDFVDGLQGVIAGDRGAVLTTADGGLTWRLEFSGVVDPFPAVAATGNGHAWAVGAAGVVRHRATGQGLMDYLAETVRPPTGSPRAPIVITGDAGFTSPLSGVRSGSGTASDPYVIEGWDIVPLATDAITLVGTTAHVVIRGNVLHDAPREHSGIRLTNVQNVVVEGNLIRSTQSGIVVSGGKDVTLADNVIERVRRHGIEAATTERLVVSGNTVRSSGANGVDLATLANPVVTGNTLAFNKVAGVRIVGQRALAVTGAMVTANAFQDNRDGLSAVNVDGLLAEGNAFLLGEDHGVSLQLCTGSIVRGNVFHADVDANVRIGEGCTDTLVAGNALHAHVRAVRLERDERTVVRANHVTEGESDGISTSGSKGPLIEDNHIVGSMLAIRIGEATTGAVVRGNFAMPFFYGIWLQGGSTGALVEGNEITTRPGSRYDAHDGVVVIQGSHGNTIRDNDFHEVTIGVSVGGGSTDIVIEENRFRDVFRAVDITMYSHRAVIRDNTVETAEQGIWFRSRSDSAIVERNTLTGVTGTVFRAGSSSDGVYRDNVVTGARVVFVSDYDCPMGEPVCDSRNNVLSGNRFSGITEAGVEAPEFFWGATVGLRLEGNLFQGEGTAWRLVDNEGFHAAGNDLSGFSVGLDATTSGTVDVRGNWWGSPDGPSGEGPGSGAAIVNDGSTVLYAPWLEAPASAMVP